MSNKEIGKTEMTTREEWFATIRAVAYAILLALFLRSCAYEPFSIPSRSMMPTLLVGDYLFVSKFSYGYGRYSFPLGLPLFEGRIFGDLPERGDVIVFRHPHRPKVDYIKRVVGLPGDHLQMKNGKLYLNGQPTEKNWVSSYYYAEGARVFSGKQYEERLMPDGKVFTTLDMAKDGPVDNTPEFIVPEGHLFFMGDNRDNSQDSRYDELGFVPFENVIGRADFIFLSLDNVPIWQVWRWPEMLRRDRLFKKIH